MLVFSSALQAIQWCGGKKLAIRFQDEIDQQRSRERERERKRETN